MGAWALEFDPGQTGGIYKMQYFNGDVFGYCYDGTGAGVWRRTPPNWTQTIAGTSRGCVWNDLMWWGIEGAGLSAGFSRSPDGVNWTEDIDYGPGAYSHWSALNGYGSYLYAAMYDFHGSGQIDFRRRDTAGNWTSNPPAYATTGHSFDIIGYGSYVYWSKPTQQVRRYYTSWENEPTLNGQNQAFFTTVGTTLYAVTADNIYRRLSGAWLKEFESPGGAWGFSGAISVGGDGNLYVAAEDGADSRLYVRVGGHWVLHSEVAGVIFESFIADANGNLFACTDSCEFYAYTVSFGVTPAGGGLAPQSIDCDADGDILYAAVYDVATGNPVLVAVPLPLASDALGAGVFNPGDGDAINVKCGNVSGQVAIAGNFAAAGNEQVEVSEDGGGTWTDIDRDAWGVETAQPLLVNPNGLANEVMVALQTAQDIVETFDGGATAWVVRNAAVGYSPGAIARLPEGDELVVGDDGANRVDYSPNRGEELTNITGAFVGNCQALEVA